VSVPLSEEEQRILQDIERSFYETDPGFADAVGANALYRHAARNCKWSAAAFLVCLFVLLASFTITPALGFVAFLGMVGATFVFVRNLRRIGVAGMRDVADSDRVRDVGRSLGEMRERMREQFRKDDD
jgi:hypothetical protein